MYRGLNEFQLKEKSNELRSAILEMLCEAGSGHSGGSLSSIDILNVLYNNVLRHDPKNPSWSERDRFILSKGHVCPALYAVLADCGYFDKKELLTLRKFGSMLQGHPDMHKTPGIEVSSGSLGQGLSVSVGIALAAKINGDKIRTYCLTGDGEMQEGQIWEALMAAGHYKLDNLCGIVDKNELQIDGEVKDVMDIDPLTDKIKAFKWNTIEINGNDVIQIEKAFREAAEYKGKPTMIIARTIKGKGVSFMENVCGWHGVAPNKEQLKSALAELNTGRREKDQC
ncbi:MAG: transketolase [Eubacteriales bacterium]|nr:transketolase [Eubacteriales bacterium]